MLQCVERWNRLAEYRLMLGRKSARPPRPIAAEAQATGPKSGPEIAHAKFAGSKALTRSGRLAISQCTIGPRCKWLFTMRNFRDVLAHLHALRSKFEGLLAS